MKRYLIICWLLLAMTPLVLGLGGCSDEPATVQGVVSQAQDPNKPVDDPANVGPGIAQAEITFSALEKVQEIQGIPVYKKGPVGYTAITDANGVFSLSVTPGTYVIDVSVNNKRVATRQVEIKGGRRIKADFNVLATP
jgi:PBP1b-binding outer membrane lipoprotein LpoB